MPKKLLQLALLAAIVAGLFVMPSAPSAAADEIMTRTPPPLKENGEGELLTGAWPRAMTLDPAGNLWVANGFDNTVIRIDEVTGKPMAGGPVSVGIQPTALAWLEANRTLWVSSYEDASLTPVVVDIQSRATAGQRVLLGDSRPVGMAVSGGTLWVITQVNGSLTAKDNLIKIDPASGKILGRLTVGRFPTAIISSASDSNPDDRLLFIANGHDDSVSMVDTRLDNGNGKVVTTFTDGVPAFPISLAFDGSFLYIGSYECKYDKEKCLESQIGRINVNSGKSAPIPGGNQTGRQVATFFGAGHVIAASGHGEGISDTNVVTVEQRLELIRGTRASKAGQESYFGTILMTKRFIYIADWTNDRIIRIPAFGAIPIPPTPTFAPITPTVPPTVTPIVICNSDPKFPPQFKPGMKGRIVNDTFVKPVRIRKEPNFGQNLTGKQFGLGEEFTVVEGPFANNQPLDPKTNPDESCFYKVEGVNDKSKAGFITEGGLASDGKDKRYYLEIVK
jgi:hypothetical protein